MSSKINLEVFSLAKKNWKLLETHSHMLDEGIALFENGLRAMALAFMLHFEAGLNHSAGWMVMNGSHLRTQMYLPNSVHDVKLGRLLD